MKIVVTVERIDGVALLRKRYMLGDICVWETVEQV